MRLRDYRIVHLPLSLVLCANEILNMGLDTVEIVLWAEETFGVEMPDEEVGTIYTVGEFANYIANKVNSTKGFNITYQDVMPHLLDILESDFNVPRNKVTIESQLVKDLGFG